MKVKLNRKQILVVAGAVVVLAALVIVLNPFGVSAGDALATWVTKDGRVMKLTRGEVYEAFGPNKDRILEDKVYQKNFVENMLYQRLQAQDAIELGMNTNAAFVKQTNDMVQNSMLIQELLQTKFPRETFSFNLEGRHVRLLMIKRDLFRQVEEPDPMRFKRMEQIRKTITNETKLRQELDLLEKATVKKPVKRTPEELVAHDKDVADKLAIVVAELKKSGGKNFIELVKKYSEHESANEGGDIGYVFPRQRSLAQPLVKAIEGLKTGEYTPAIRVPEGFAIAWVEKTVSLDEGNLKKYFTDEAQINRAKDDAWYAAVWQFIDEIVSEDRGKNVFVNLDKLGSSDTNSVILEIKSDRFKTKMTLGDLQAKVAAIPPHFLSRYGIVREENDKSPLTAAELGLVFDWEMSVPMLKYGAHRSGISESEKFRNKLEQTANGILARMLTEQKRNSVKVEEGDIVTQYTNNTKSYVKRIQTGTDAAGTPVFQTQQLSLDEARDQIRNELQGKRINDIFQNWKKSMFTKYQARINESKFEIRKKQAPKKAEEPKKPEAAKPADNGAKKNNGK